MTAQVTKLIFPNESKWLNFEGHKARNNSCEIEITERVIKKLHAGSKVRRQRPLQILAGEKEFPRLNPQLFPTYFKCKMDLENKRKCNPWAIGKSFSKPAIIKSKNESEFVIEISDVKQSKNLPTLTSLSFPQCYERVKVEIFACEKISRSECLVYIHDYNIPEIDDYGSELKEEYNLSDKQKATWIKTKNTTSNPLLLTFKEK